MRIRTEMVEIGWWCGEEGCGGMMVDGGDTEIWVQVDLGKPRRRWGEGTSRAGRMSGCARDAKL